MFVMPRPSATRRRAASMAASASSPTPSSDRWARRTGAMPRAQPPPSRLPLPSSATSRAAAEDEAPHDRRREDHEQRGGLCGVLREPGREREEGNDERPAAASEQPRGHADDHTEHDEHDIERRPAHQRAPSSTATPTRNVPNTTLSRRSSIRASQPAPTRAPTIDPAASAIAVPYRTSPATP